MKRRGSSGTVPACLDDRGLIHRGEQREDHGPQRLLVVAGGHDVDRVRIAVEEPLGDEVPAGALGHPGVAVGAQEVQRGHDGRLAVALVAAADALKLVGGR
jgi:hypothetical protein